MKPTAWFATVAAFALAALAPCIAPAQSYPSKPVRLICPYPPSGATDITARAIASELSKSLGQPVIVDNRPGAGGNIGAELAAKAAPDGYTILTSISALHGIVPVLYSKLNYDPNKDLAPVIVLVSYSNVLVVNPSVKAASVKELIALAKAEPGKLTFASSGSGATTHMSGEMFKHLTGVDIVHVPYKGAAPAMTDLLGGQVNMMFDAVPTSLPHIKSGKLRALGVTGAKREPALPDVPTIAEAGVPGYEASVWFGLEVPASTPKAIIARLSEASMKGLAAPEFAKRMTELGFTIVGGTPEQAGEMIKVEIQRWGPVVKASGAKAE